MDFKSYKQPPNPQAATRKCLCCGRPFYSEWVGNRMCRPCKGQGDGRGPRGGDRTVKFAVETKL